MDPAAIVKFVLVAGIVAIVISIGVRSRPMDALLMVRQPQLGVRAMLAMFVLVPAFVLLITWLVPVSTPVRIALLALSVSPMPPILPNKEAKVGGGADYAIGLQVLATAFSILAVPVMIMIAGRVFGPTGGFEPWAMTRTLLVTVAVPLAGGMALGHFLPAARNPIATWAGRLGSLALLVGAPFLLFATWHTMLGLLGDGTLLVIVAVIVLALGVGHLLGGPDEGNRGALAVASAARHPGVAIVVSIGLFPQHGAEITAAVLIYLLANVILTIPYVKWRKTIAKAPPPAG